MNTAALTPFMFSIALAYAVIKHDLFEIDAMVKRGGYYLVLTTAVGAMFLANAVVWTVASWLGGLLSDRVGRKPVLVFGTLGQAPPASLVHQDADAGPGPQQLLDEERGPVGALHDRLDQLIGERVLPALA